MSERRRPESEGFDELLREWLRDDAPASAPDEILESIRRSATTTAQRQRRPAWSPFVGLVAAVLAVAAVVLSVQLTSDVGRHEPTSIPAPSGGATPSDVAVTSPAGPSATASPIPSSEPWNRADVELPAENSSRMHAAASGVGGFVAVGGGGSVEGLGGALAWHSTDGQSWSLTLDRHAERDGSQMLDVVATAVGYVGVGHNVQGTPVWISGDGLSWRELDDPSAPAGSSHSLNALAGGNASIGAIGFTSEDDRQVATAWASEDGTTWTRLDVPDAFARSRPIDIAIGPDGSFVVVGIDSIGEGDPVAWVIRDGMVSGPGDLRSDDSAAFASAVVATMDGYLALGHGWDAAQMTNMPLAWRSSDGMTWELREHGEIGFPIGAAGIARRGVIAVGAAMTLEEGWTSAWEVSDEGAWRPILMEPGNGSAHAAIEGPNGRLLVVGSSDPDGEAVVWIEP